MNRVKITKFRLGTYDNLYFLYNELKQCGSEIVGYNEVQRSRSEILVICL
jgi:hypothetical protein